MQSNSKHFYWLDLVRFLAAFLVLIGHLREAFFGEFGELPFSQQAPLMLVFYSITRMGHEGVLIFFVLSGFLVGGKTMQKLGNGIFDMKSYFIDRSVRILVPMISVLILIWIVNIIIGVENSFIAFAGNLLSLQVILVDPVSPHLWSLTYEVWFYIMMGVIALFFSTTTRNIKLIAFVGLFVSCLVFFRLTFSYLTIWFLGAFSYFLISPKKNTLIFFSSVLFWIFMLVLMQITTGSQLANVDFIDREITEMLFAIATCFMIQQIVMFAPQNKMMQGLDRIGTRLASFSYTLYLTHYPIIKLMSFWGIPQSKQLDGVSIMYFLLGILICLIIGYCIYWMFEKRTPEIKQYVKRLVEG